MLKSYTEWALKQKTFLSMLYTSNNFMLDNICPSQGQAEIWLPDRNPEVSLFLKCGIIFLKVIKN